VKTGCHDAYLWLEEATATWAIQFLYPKEYGDHEGERYYAPHYLNAPGQPLDRGSEARHYGAYLFLLFLSQRFGPEIVRDIWEETSTAESVRAVSQALERNGSNFKTMWPEFVSANWNRGPMDWYQKIDSMPTPFSAGALETGQGIVELKDADFGDFVFQMDGSVQYLAAHYFHVQFPSLTARSVVFTDFGLVASNPAAHIDALIKFEGKDWEVQEWTKDLTEGFILKGLCRDTIKERVEELVVIIGNSDWEKMESLKPPGDHQPRLIANNIGCWKWKASIKNIARNPFYPPYEITDAVTTEGELTAVERQPPCFLPGLLEAQLKPKWYKVMTGCSGMGERDFDSVVQLGLNNFAVWEDFPPDRRKYHWVLGDFPPIFGPDDVVTFTCPGDEKVPSLPVWTHGNGGAPAGGSGTVPPDGIITDSIILQPLGITTEWSFEPLQE
jgi:hypothetical protein